MIKDFNVTEEEIKKEMELPGLTRGFQGDLNYVLEKKGPEGVKKVEKETEKLGYPIKYEDLSESKWYPIGLRMVSLYSILAAFDWGKKELAELAECVPKVSFVMKFFMRYFASPQKTFKVAAPIIWKRYFNVGAFETVYFKRTGKDGYAVLRIKDFRSSSIFCFFLGHFFIGAFKLAARFKEVDFEETKCVFKGNPYHEYLIKWLYF